MDAKSGLARFTALGAFGLLVLTISHSPAQQTAPRNLPLSGAQVYYAYCAACHGEGGRGDGPVAPTLKIPVPDLTRLTVRNHGTFPADEVKRIINGEAALPAHGSRVMPIWGPVFHQTDANENRGGQLLQNLVQYLQFIQRH